MVSETFLNSPRQIFWVSSYEDAHKCACHSTNADVRLLLCADIAVCVLGKLDVVAITWDGLFQLRLLAQDPGAVFTLLRIFAGLKSAQFG